MCWKASPTMCVPLPSAAQRQESLAAFIGVEVLSPTHPYSYFEQVLRSYWLHLAAGATKVVKPSRPWELGTIIPVKICPFLSSVSRKCHVERVCKYGVHHNPPGLLFHELCISKYFRRFTASIVVFLLSITKAWPKVSLAFCSLLLYASGM